MGINENHIKIYPTNLTLHNQIPRNALSKKIICTHFIIFCAIITIMNNRAVILYVLHFYKRVTPQDI